MRRIVCVCVCVLRVAVRINCGAYGALCRVARYASVVRRMLRVALQGAFCVSRVVTCRMLCVTCWFTRHTCRIMHCVSHVVHLVLCSARCVARGNVVASHDACFLARSG